MTSAAHLSGSDRIAEVVEQYGWPHDSIIVNVQGDEPYIPHQNIAQVAENLAANDKAAMATLVTKFADAEELDDSNNVKVVVDRNNFALYFSRAVIPHLREPLESRHCWRHVGIYAYTAGFLMRFVQLQPAPLELSEKLEQLRALWHGEKIHVAEAVCQPPTGVDTPEDLAKLLTS
jgi:3-deoxy-manno-octulosonate cytidylyltransferase (CMP-KDO synthetase)